MSIYRKGKSKIVKFLIDRSISQKVTKRALNKLQKYDKNTDLIKMMQYK